MRKLILIGFIPLIGLLSCGGGPSSQETGIVSASTSYLQQDVICCLSGENSTSGTCSGVPQPESFTVAITNENLTGNNTQPIQVRGCTAQFYPKNGAPSLPDGYVSCTPVTINPGEEGNVTVTLQSSLVEMMQNYYESLGKILSYREVKDLMKNYPYPYLEFEVVFIWTKR